MNKAEQAKAALERYAPAGFDITDDMTVPFALELVAKDEQIAQLKSWLTAAQNERDYWKYLHDEKEKRHARAVEQEACK